MDSPKALLPNDLITPFDSQKLSDRGQEEEPAAV
jgi:hypothetical protein